MFEKVLVALDFSVYSQNILDRIAEIPGIQEVAGALPVSRICRVRR